MDERCTDQRGIEAIMCDVNHHTCSAINDQTESVMLFEDLDFGPERRLYLLVLQFLSAGQVYFIQHPSSNLPTTFDLNDDPTLLAVVLMTDPSIFKIRCFEDRIDVDTKCTGIDPLRDEF